MTLSRRTLLAASATLAAPAIVRAQGTPPIRVGEINSYTAAAAFTFHIQNDLELTGPMSLRLWISVEGANDVSLFVGVEKWSGARYVPFEGSYGFGRNRVATGWQRAVLARTGCRGVHAKPARTHLPQFAAAPPRRGRSARDRTWAVLDPVPQGRLAAIAGGGTLAGTAQSAHGRLSCILHT